MSTGSDFHPPVFSSSCNDQCLSLNFSTGFLWATGPFWILTYERDLECIWRLMAWAGLLVYTNINPFLMFVTLVVKSMFSHFWLRNFIVNWFQLVTYVFGNISHRVFTLEFCFGFIRSRSEQFYSYVSTMLSKSEEMAERLTERMRMSMKNLLAPSHPKETSTERGKLASINSLINAKLSI